MPLDPVFAEMLKQMAEADGPAMKDMAPSEARMMYRVMQEALPRPDLPSVEDSSADGVPIRIYRPTGERTACIVYFHGGGWVIGDLETHDGVCRQLAEASGMTVIAVDYRLAPEEPFPASIDDCYKATAWIAANGDTLNIDADKIAVAGDSAGGNLSTCVCLKARAEGGPHISFQLLVYPVTDTAMDTQSYVDNAEGFLLTKDTMTWFWDSYVGDDAASRSNPLASPMAENDLSGLPPACVITAEFDPLRDEGESYAERLKAAGVTVTIKRYDGMIHGFYGMTHLVEGAKDALALSVSELKSALG